MIQLVIKALQGNKHLAANSAAWVLMLSIIALVYSGTPPFESAKPVHAGELQEELKPMQEQQKANTVYLHRLMEQTFREAIWRQEDRLELYPADRVAKDRLRRIKADYDAWKAEVQK